MFLNQNLNPCRQALFMIWRTRTEENSLSFFPTNFTFVSLFLNFSFHLVIYLLTFIHEIFQKLSCSVNRRKQHIGLQERKSIFIDVKFFFCKLKICLLFSGDLNYKFFQGSLFEKWKVISNIVTTSFFKLFAWHLCCIDQIIVKVRYIKIKCVNKYKSRRPYLPFLIFSIMIMILNNGSTVPNPSRANIKELATKRPDFVDIFAIVNEFPGFVFSTVSGVGMNLNFVSCGVGNLKGEASCDIDDGILIWGGFLDVELLVWSSMVFPNNYVVLFQLFLRIIYCGHIQRLLIFLGRHNLILHLWIRELIFLHFHFIHLLFHPLYSFTICHITFHFHLMRDAHMPYRLMITMSNDCLPVSILVLSIIANGPHQQILFFYFYTSINHPHLLSTIIQCKMVKQNVRSMPNREQNYFCQTSNVLQHNVLQHNVLQHNVLQQLIWKK